MHYLHFVTYYLEAFQLHYILMFFSVLCDTSSCFCTSYCYCSLVIKHMHLSMFIVKIVGMDATDTYGCISYTFISVWVLASLMHENAGSTLSSTPGYCGRLCLVASKQESGDKLVHLRYFPHGDYVWHCCTPQHSNG